MNGLEMLVLDVGDWPGGALSAMECQFPEAPDGGIDLALPIVCPEHARTFWWCPNASLVWCDGGPPAYDWHQLELPERGPRHPE